MSRTPLELPRVSEHGLTLEVVAGQLDHVRIAGHGDTLGAPVLDSYLKQLHEVALQTGLAEITLELDQLTFINSTCLKAMVSWIYKVDTTGRPYQIRLLRDLALRWQKNSLATLQRLAPEVVRVEDHPH
jgi:hypothetical protein